MCANILSRIRTLKNRGVLDNSEIMTLSLKAVMHQADSKTHRQNENQ